MQRPVNVSNMNEIEFFLQFYTLNHWLIDASKGHWVGVEFFLKILRNFCRFTKEHIISHQYLHEKAKESHIIRYNYSFSRFM